MISYAETNECRRTVLLHYFGESFPSSDCTGCDNCLNPRETVDGTVLAQKFLSCVHRVAASAGFGFGMNHIIQVLLGEKTEAIERRGHERLSTFGVGREESRETWQWIGRELQRLGLVDVAPGKFATLTVTQEGMAALRERTPIALIKPFERARAKPRRKVSIRSEQPCDEKLFAELKTVRRRLADERNVPAYIVFSDATLREMASALPTTRQEFEQITGVGERKANDFAETFTAAISRYLGAGASDSG